MLENQIDYNPEIISYNSTLDDIAEEKKELKKILVVDDEPDVAEVTRRMLQGCGYEVKTAATAEEALDILREKPSDYGMIITDIIMPGLTGEKFVELIRKNPNSELSRIPIIGITGYGYGKDQLMKEQGVKILGKPYTLQKLLDAVEAAEHKNYPLKQ